MRIFKLVLATAVLGLASFSPVQAQEATGSISGQVLANGGPISIGHVFVVPAPTPQPIEVGLGLNFSVDVDEAGDFSVSGLASGDYLIAVPGVSPEDFVTPMPETVTFFQNQTEYVLPALRVSLVEGQDLTGIEIVISAEFSPMSDDFGLSGPSDLSLVTAPDSGAGPGKSNGAGVPGTLVVLAITALLAGFGLAIRLLGRRAS